MRKINVKVTVDLLIRADDDADIDEVVEWWASSASRSGNTADIDEVTVIDSVVTDSR